MLRENDLIFCKTESGVTSCGYNISNMLLKNTLNMHTPNSQRIHMSPTGKDDIRIAKLMEDLVVPSGLYYCHPMTKHKVFNYKSSNSREKGEKGENEEINITNGVLDDSVYDKLLSLVSTDKKKLFDRKTRKNKSMIFQKIKDKSTDVNAPFETKDTDSIKSDKGEKGEKGEKNTKRDKKKSLKIKINTEKLLEKQTETQKPNQRKTKKVRFAD
jgi:hypothetical protein